MNTTGYQEKHHHLHTLIQDYQSAVIGLSGGIDSLLLTLIAHQKLADNMCAVTVVTPLSVQSDAEEARSFCHERGITHRTVSVNVLSNAEVRANGPERCYHCKRMILTELCNIQRELGARVVCEGSNIDDGDDYRPGLRAIRELSIRSPLMLAGFTKQDIRHAARDLGISGWDKASETCYATRVPYFEPLTVRKINTIAEAEAAIKQLGIPMVRVRYHDSIARIETDPAYMRALVERRQEVVSALHACGFTYATVDLAGYTRGSLNVSLEGYSEEAVDE